jgi:hypothetical protein
MKKFIAATAVLALICLAIWTVPYWTHGTKDVTVTGVDHKIMKDHGKTRDIYLVFTTDETYKNVDSPAYLKFNSSDIQGKLIQTGRFRISYYGFRVPIFSMYKNITKAERLN